MLVPKASALDNPLESNWYNGRLFLKNGEAKQGLIAYDHDKPFVILKEAHSIKTYNVRQVESFEFLDGETHTFRWFYALPHQERGRKVELFFELIVDAGNLVLLSREILTTADRPLAGHPFLWETTTVKGEIYYLLDKNTAAVSLLPGNTDQLLEAMGENKQVMQQFIETHKPDLQSRKDLIKLFYYLRKLQQEEGENLEAAAQKTD